MLMLHHQRPALTRAPGPATLRLPYSPASAGTARLLVRAKLTEWKLPQLIDDAELIMSELVGNAARTGCQTSMMVGIRRASSDTVRLLVADGSAILPVLIDAGPDAESGRGLFLVDRLTRQRWGVTPWPHGNVVHATLSMSAACTRPPPPPPPPNQPAGE
ncbi:ATP-binding protein, partial [Kitasatospora sp. NPDC057541]|uniref:ATP-binding protein n=1 Tax=Kitasatospora sp. NPDC057541 TaxID=3346161 RepID=UPI0036CD1615